MPSAFFNDKLKEFRRSLAQVDALPQLSFLALLIGACTGALIVAFRLAIESPVLFLPMAHAEDFESLPPEWRSALIITGALIMGTALQLMKKSHRSMSVSHVIDRLHNHQGHLPTANWIAQFWLAIVAIVSGQCVGREGPAVHLGAGTSSRIGRWLRLPNNSMQTLIACGVAAAISASFDTPLAGVIFAMEVIVMEYSIVGFVPVILASVIGAAICKGLLGDTIVFDAGSTEMTSLSELPFVVVLGLILALLAGSYIRLHVLTMRLQRIPVFLRVMAAGAFTAAVAAFVPEIMGLGYDTIAKAISGEIVISAFIIIALSKWLVTPVVVALGIPGGLIGPSLVIGACSGAAVGALVQAWFPSLDVHPSLYVLLGMTGMMAAVINAPLAALVAVLELSHNPGVIFPAMLMIVVACLTTRQLFGVRSIFIEQLSVNGRDIEMGPAVRALRRIGVMSLVNRRFLISDETISLDEARYILSAQPEWVVFSFEERLFALWTADLAHFLDNSPEPVSEGKESIRLSEVPGRRHMLHPVLESESLYDALRHIRRSQCEVLYVTSNLHSHRSVHGLITLDAIQNHYQPKEI